MLVMVIGLPGRGHVDINLGEKKCELGNMD